MTYEVLILILWATGAVVTLVWMLIVEWPTRREDASDEGIPNDDAFLVPLFLLTASLWFALPAIRYMERRGRR